MSDSSEEDTSKFVEAVDVNFSNIHYSKYENSQDKSSSENKDDLPPSLRKKDDEDEFCKNNLIRVTPEFRKFVAKKLEKSLDEYLNENVTPANSENVNGKKISHETESGIKLFKSSQLPISEFIEHKDGEEVVRQHNKDRKRKKKKEENGVDEIEKVKCVAVDGEYVLSGKETYVWSERSKGNVVELEQTSQANVFRIKERGYVSPSCWTRQ